MEKKNGKKRAATNKADVKLTIKILKRRKENGSLNKQLELFDEIRQQIEELDEAIVEALPSSTPVEQDFVETIASDVLVPSTAFALFTEDSVELKLFLPPDEVFFGFPVSSRSDQYYRNLILSGAFELRWRNVIFPQGIRLYVFYLASVTSNTDLLSACFEFLFNFPCSLASNDVLPIIINFGVPADVLFEDSARPPLSSYLRPGQKRRKDFPSSNIDKVTNYLIFCIKSNLLEVGTETKPLVVAIARLTQDSRIRQCSLLSSLTSLLTALLLEAEKVVGVDVTSSWLLFPDLHPLVQLDICRTSLRPLSPIFQHSLILNIVNSILKSKLKLSSPFGIKDLKLVLRYCNKKKVSLSLLELRVVIELLIASLPIITAKFNDIQPIYDELSALESLFIKCKESTELVEVTSVTSKLHSLLMIKGGSRFMAKANDLLRSPRRPGLRTTEL